MKVTSHSILLETVHGVLMEISLDAVGKNRERVGQSEATTNRDTAKAD